MAGPTYRKKNVQIERITNMLKDLEHNPGPCTVDILIAEIAGLIVRVTALEANVRWKTPIASHVAKKK